MNAFKVLVFLGLVAAASSVTLLGCGPDGGRYSADWDACTELPDNNGYVKLSLVSGSLVYYNATALFAYYSANDKCASSQTPITISCSCNNTNAVVQLQCGSAASVIPSALFIVAAIMVHLF